MTIFTDPDEKAPADTEAEKEGESESANTKSVYAFAPAAPHSTPSAAG